jgi:hypothetical protein
MLLRLWELPDGFPPRQDMTHVHTCRYWFIGTIIYIYIFIYLFITECKYIILYNTTPSLSLYIWFAFGYPPVSPFIEHSSVRGEETAGPSRHEDCQPSDPMVHLVRYCKKHVVLSRLSRRLFLFQIWFYVTNPIPIILNTPKKPCFSRGFAHPWKPWRGCLLLGEVGYHVHFSAWFRFGSSFRRISPDDLNSGSRLNQLIYSVDSDRTSRTKWPVVI